jgi:hypothetical protein
VPNGNPTQAAKEPSPNGDFVWHAHAYTNDYIRFADTKAGAVIAWCSGLIAALFAAKVHHHFMHASNSTVLGLLALVAFAALSAGLLAAFGAIHPRLWSSTEQVGFIFWERVRRHRDAAAFWEELKKHQAAACLTEETAGHLYDLAGICKSKYRWVAWSMWLALAGSVAGALVVLFTA